MLSLGLPEVMAFVGAGSGRHKEAGVVSTAFSQRSLQLTNPLYPPRILTLEWAEKQGRETFGVGAEGGVPGTAVAVSGLAGLWEEPGFSAAWSPVSACPLCLPGNRGSSRLSLRYIPFPPNLARDCTRVWSCYYEP